MSLVVDKLLPLLTQEVKLLKGVHDELVGVKDELEVIRAFLKDADSKAEKEGIGEGVKALVNQIREEAHRIEDVIDDYMLHVARHPDHRHGLLRRMVSLIKSFSSRHEIASEIKDIKSSLLKIKNISQTFNFISSNQGASNSNAGRGLMHHPRLSSLFCEEAELVGIESRRDELISYLVSGVSQRKVIAVVGLGGVGKTTLAKKVYDNHRVTEHFRYHAWITVSQSYDKTELLRSMLKGFYKAKNEPFPDKIVKMEKDEELIGEIREKLRQERYFVVFDDVWEIGFWGNMELALLDHDNGSRILATTRNEAAARFCRGSSSVHVHRIDPLPRKEAWDLFCKKAFRFQSQGQCPKDLEELSRDIVRRCGGLPLAIVAVSGLLATKEKSVQEWKKVIGGLGGSAMTSDPYINNVTSILSLSYGDLPYHLKSCFLYFGMFPEDFSIKRRRIIQLWVANGLVEEQPGMTLEEVGEEYFIELICRSLVQVDEVSVKGVPKTCRVHDMVLEVILSKSEELSLCHVSSSCSTFEGIARHLSISNRGSNPPKSSTRSQTRSIMVFDKVMLLARVRVIFAKFKLLTSLDFEDCPIDHLPKELGNLLHLRYLNLRNTDVEELPRSIGKLHNLECLDLRFSLVKELPVEISDFPKLKHLLAHGGYATGLKIKGSFKHLEFLQTLFTIKVEDDVSFLNDGLQVLTKTRKFGICNLKREQGGSLCTVLEKMTSLQSLLVYSVNHRVEILDLESEFSPPIQLQSLWLGGQLDRLPNWISKLHNLSKLILSYSNLMEDSVEVLQALPNLKYLVLFWAYNGERMHFEGGGFQKLQYLYLAGLDYLNEMLIDEGALPLLESLEIGPCPMLEEVPSGLENLRCLEVLSFAWMTNEFNQRWSQQESQISRHVRIHRSEYGTYDPDDKASIRAWEERKFGASKHRFG